MMLDLLGAPVSLLSKLGDFREEESQAGDTEMRVELGPASVL